MLFRSSESGGEVNANRSHRGAAAAAGKRTTEGAGGGGEEGGAFGGLSMAAPLAKSQAPAAAIPLLSRARREVTASAATKLENTGSAAKAAAKGRPLAPGGAGGRAKI